MIGEILDHGGRDILAEMAASGRRGADRFSFQSSRRGLRASRVGPRLILAMGLLTESLMADFVAVLPAMRAAIRTWPPRGRIVQLLRAILDYEIVELHRPFTQP